MIDCVSIFSMLFFTKVPSSLLHAESQYLGIYLWLKRGMPATGIPVMIVVDDATFGARILFIVVIYLPVNKLQSVIVL